MPHTLASQKLTAFAITFALSFGIFLIAESAAAAPPVDEVTWSNENCAGGLASATVTASGKGKWAILEVEVSSDGGATYGSLGSQYEIWRIEHDAPQAIGWSGDVVFRARDVKNNGSPIGPWTESQPIDC